MKVFLCLFLFISTVFALLVKRGPNNPWGQAEIDGLYELKYLMAIPQYNMNLFPNNKRNVNPYGATTSPDGRRWVASSVCQGYNGYNAIINDVSTKLNTIPDLTDTTVFTIGFLEYLDFSFSRAQAFFALSLDQRKGLKNQDSGHTAILNAIQNIFDRMTAWNTAVCNEMNRRTQEGIKL